jgi:hypothetical protein
MPLTRRQAIRQFLFVSAGVALIPSCMEDRSKSSILYRNLDITADQEKLLAELAETVIPKTSTPGAKDLSAHLFALKMIDDCRSKEDQDTFMEGLRAFEKTAGKDFARQSMQERAKILEPLDKDKESKDPVAVFYRTMKRLTIQAYTSSEYFLTKVQVYELVPGRYHGCVPVKAS